MQPRVRCRLLSALAAGIVLLASLALPVQAQGRSGSSPHRDTLRTGDVIRVWAHSPRLDGAVGRAGALLGDTLLVEELDIARPRIKAAQLVLGAITRLEVRRGARSNTGRLTALMVGGIAGSAVGTLVGRESGDSGPGSEFARAAGGVAGGLVGFLVGATAGGVLAGRERWVEVPVARIASP